MAAVSGENEDKCSKRLKNNDNDTLCLSDLPDEILLYILSSLPTTKSVVATSVLSRRWQHLWKSIPNLQLIEFQFNRQRDRFINFAERALAARGGSSLVSFSLSCRVRKDARRINNWICSAVQFNVEQLSLDLQQCASSFCLPSCLLVCQSLVKLDLGLFEATTIKFRSVIDIPSLKYLKLTKVEFADNKSAERLLSHPSLEELIFCDCRWAKVRVDVNVNSPKLQRLSIQDRDMGNEERQICFIGDNLRFFWYEGIFTPTQYCICGSTMQLREAGIVFDDQVMYIGDVAYKCYRELINSFSMVQNLTLSEPAAKNLYFYGFSRRLKLETTTPVFERLTRLNLSSYLYTSPTIIDSAHLRMIFDRCPHLEHLNFIKVEFYCRNVDTPLLKCMPTCFRTHLKKISIHGYDSLCKEQSVAINVLLHCALILEEMVLHCKMDARIYRQRVAEFELELNKRPKVSENCRVSLVLD